MSGPAVLVVQHLPHEHSGVLGEVLVTTGCRVATARAWADPIPTDPTAFDGIVVLGGDMNTDEGDRWPHLAEVRQLLADAVAAEVPTLGLCLGAQLLAEATGGAVRHGTPEIGYPQVFLTPSGRAHPVLAHAGDGSRWFNAHADHITAPPGSVLLAFSDGAAVHAFAVGSGLGLQFHPEIDASFVAGYVIADGVEAYLSANGWTGAALLDEARRRNEGHRAAGRALALAWVRSLG